MAKPDANAPLGEGGRFAALEQKIEGEGKSKEAAGAIAASIGRKKYGNKGFQKLANQGK